MENQIKEGESLYKATIDSLDSALHLTDKDHVILFYNETFEKWSKERGCAGKIKGENLLDACPFLDEKALKEYKTVLKTGETLITEDVNEFDGKLIYTETKKVPFVHDGVVEGVITLITDITETKKEHLAFQKYFEKYSALLESMPDLMFILDKDGTYLDYHANKDALLALSREKIIGSNLRELYDEEEGKRHIAFLRKALETGEMQRYEYDIKYGDYSGAYEARISPMSDERVLAIIRDITKRKESENIIMRTSLERDALLRAMPDMMFIMDLDGTFRDFHANFSDELALPRNKIIGEKLSSIGLSDNDFERHLKYYRKAIKTGKVQTFEYELQINNEPKIFEARISPISEDKVLAIVRDITERKKSEEKLRNAEERVRTFLETADDMLYFQSLDGSLSMLNEANARITGYSIKEFTEDPMLWEKIVHPDDAKIAEEFFRKYPEGTDKFEVEYRLKDKKGRWRYIQSRMVGVKNKEGNYIGYNCIDRDITDLKETEQKLRELNERFANLMQTSPDGIVITDGEGKILEINQAVCNIMETPREDIIGKTAYGMTNGRVSKQAYLTQLANYRENREKIPREEITIPTKTGREIYIEQSTSVMLDEGDNIIYVFAIFRDITERKRLEEEILRAQKLESIGELAGGIAHDFNNILTAAIGNISLAKIDPEMGEGLLELMNGAETALERASILTNQLLTFSRGGAPLKETLDITDIIKRCVALSFSGSKSEVVYDIDAEIYNISVDPNQISQVISNIALNARQAMPDGGTFTVKCENLEEAEDIEHSGPFIKITLADTGTGIPAEILDRIYDPYFSTKNDSSGLGLSTVYSVIKRHQGKIDIDTDGQEGTKFIITLPATRDKETDTALSPAPTGKTILIMDDEPPVRKTLRILLESLGQKVVEAEGGNKVMKILEDIGRKNIDYFILDLTIAGGIGGVKTMEMLLEKYPDIKAIATSGYSNDPVLADYGKYGFKGRLVKPFTIDDLKKALKILEQ